MIPAKPRRRYKPYARCKLRGHLLTDATRKPGTCGGCLACTAIRNERPFCPRGHPLIPGNTYPHRNGVRCLMCQRNHNATHNKKFGIVRKTKPPKTEAERWERILKDFNLGMCTGESNLYYGDVPLAVAEQQIIHKRYAAGHKRQRYG